MGIDPSWRERRDTVYSGRGSTSGYRTFNNVVTPPVLGTILIRLRTFALYCGPLSNCSAVFSIHISGPAPLTTTDASVSVDPLGFGEVAVSVNPTDHNDPFSRYTVSGNAPPTGWDWVERTNNPCTVEVSPPNSYAECTLHTVTSDVVPLL